MALYVYIANDKDGQIYKGNIEARNEAELRDRLKSMGFYVSSIKRERVVFRLSGTKVAHQDLVVFSRQFSTMISAGLSLSKSLKAMEKQTDNPALTRIINDIRLDIEGGVSLSEAMEKHKAVFSDFFIALIGAGEAGGILSKVLERLADHLEKEDELARLVRGAFAYPAIVGTLALLVMGFLVIVIVPVFQGIYARMNLSLPVPTLMLIGFSNLLRSFWWLIIAFAGGMIFSFKRIKKMPLLRARLDKIKLEIPIFGKFIQKVGIARFIRTFGDMVLSGVNILEGIRVADRAAGNKVISRYADKMNESINRGGLISDALQDQDIFPAVVVQMISSGEETGKLGLMLDKIAKGLERDVDDAVKRLVVKIEPLMTFMLAIIVGFIAVAIYLPIFDVISQISVKG
ncbi:MAG: type II secretion system F family protein [Candidatus Omnitrophota bacterium]